MTTTHPVPIDLWSILQRDARRLAEEMDDDDESPDPISIARRVVVAYAYIPGVREYLPRLERDVAKYLASIRG